MKTKHHIILITLFMLCQLTVLQSKAAVPHGNYTAIAKGNDNTEQALAPYSIPEKLGLTKSAIIPVSSLPANTIEDSLNISIDKNKTIVDSMVSSYYRGIDDADSTFYTRKSCKRVVFFASAIASPVIGLIPAIISSSTAPKITSMNIDDKTMVHNTAYMKGYKYQAGCIKKKAVWGSYIAGSVIWGAVIHFIIL